MRTRTSFLLVVMFMMIHDLAIALEKPFAISEEGRNDETGSPDRGRH